MKLGDIKGEFAPSRKANGVKDLRSDNRFVFEPLNAMNSFDDSFDPGLDGANWFNLVKCLLYRLATLPIPNCGFKCWADISRQNIHPVSNGGSFIASATSNC